MIDTKIQHLFMSFIMNENLYQLFTSHVYLKNVLVLAVWDYLLIFIYILERQKNDAIINESIVELLIGPYESKFNFV